MRFGVLGPVEVQVDGAPAPVGGPTVRALPAMLLLDAGRVVPAQRLIDGLYGEEPPGGTANALQSHVSRLRRGLGDAAPVEWLPAGYRIVVDGDAVDVQRFERLARDGRRAMAGGRYGTAAGLFEEAPGLWRGPALADVGAPFAEAQAARLEEERALLMRALHGCGRRAEALAVFEDGRRTLAEELGADPSRELADVHLSILRGEPGAVRSNLPARLTSFVGRDEELRRVRKMLADGRLVTLLGPGGAGKTRLAVEAAGREHGEVRFVDLAPVGPGEVAKALLGALGPRQGGMRPAPGDRPGAVERLVTALDGRRLLLVLDNCEHVVAPVATLAHRLLSACPELRVLATSREALGITGEALRPLPPLELPPACAAVGELAAYPAVRLFLDRAAAVRPGFAVDGGNAEAVLRICRALDGLPLAIELAAARLRSLPVTEVATRLDDRFRLLSRGDRSAPPRHRTLRAVVEWSRELLDEAEQTLARRLTVFSGGLTLEAAAQVCDLDDAAELVAELADKSLLQSDGVRYRMLDTVRAFCAERLAEAGGTERFERAHAEYFLRLARRAGPHLRSFEQLDWLGLLAADHGNLHAALRRSIRVDAALALLNEALELMRRLGALEDTADLLYQRGFVLILGGDLDAAQAEFERGVELARRAGTPDKIAGGYHGLGEVARLRGDVAGARRLYETALTGYTSERFIAVAVRGSALVGLGWLAVAEDDRERARKLFFEALDMSFDHPIFMYRALAAAGLAGVAVAEGDGERAAALLGAAAAFQGVQVAGDPDTARVSSAARALTGDAAYEAAFARAAALPRDEARALLTER